MTTFKIILAGLFLCTGIYLFVSAPPKMMDVDSLAANTRVVEVERMFNAINAVNEVARTIYTKQIVGAGKKVGLKFGEDWAEPDVEAGPLPALFLRLAAQKLEAKPPPLGLYLGSDEPINVSNLFKGDQAISFVQLKETKAAIFSTLENIGYVAMYPDVASAQACVSCHNDHADSPKKDWKLNDIMGATTWTYPRSTVASDEYLATTEAVFDAIEEVYLDYLAKVETFKQPVLVGAEWPKSGRKILPDAATFMAAVKAKSSVYIVSELVLISDQQSKLVDEDVK